MATVAPAKPTFDRRNIEQRVTHPLQSLSLFIRCYVVVEGFLIWVLYLALCFWLGLGLDYGFFKLTGLMHFSYCDWVEVLPWWFRGIVLGVLVLGMITLVSMKVFTRLFREFSDRALALVLERRFPKLLGDRLITAIELADPQVAERYGYSQAMVDRTRQEAAERVGEVPVGQVFNWTRLIVLAFLAGLLTVGLYLFVGVVYCLVQWRSPVDFMVRFHHVATIWAERNLLLQQSYWPRKAHLELLAPEFTTGDPDTLHHNRNEPLPQVKVRAIKWVIADNKADNARYGWRSMKWSDLNYDLAGTALPDEASLSSWPSDWAGTWTVDQVDLALHKNDVDQAKHDAAIYKAVQSVLEAAGNQPAWQTRRWSDMKEQGPGGMALWSPDLLRDLEADERTEFIRPSAWPIDWQSRWTLLQVREEMAKVNLAQLQSDAAAYEALLKVFDSLNEQADGPWLERKMRRLELPDKVMLYYSGASVRDDVPLEGREGNEFHGTFLAEVKESVRFTVNAADFYTPSKNISLEPPPRLTKLTRDEFQPAYIYHRTPAGMPAEFLKGKKHLIHNKEVSLSDSKPLIQIPAGTNIVLYAEVDKEVQSARAEWRIGQLAEAVPGKKGRPADKKPDEVGARDNLPIEEEHRFQIEFLNVTKPITIDFEFSDTNGLKGRREILIQPIGDTTPQVEVQVEVLRKTSQGYLITAWNLIPFSGKIVDDRGIAGVDYVMKLQGVQSAGSAERRTLLGAVSGLQLVPANPGQVLAAPGYLGWLGKTMQVPADNEDVAPVHLAMESFTRLLRDKPADELPLVLLVPQLLKGRSVPQLEDILRQLREKRGDIAKMGTDFKDLNTEQIQALGSEVKKIAEALDKSRGQTRQVNEELRQLRSGLGKAEPETLKRFDKFVLAELDAALSKDFDTATRAIESFEEQVNAGKADADDADKTVKELDHVLDRLNFALDTLQKVPRHGPITEFKIEYDTTFDPEREPRNEGFDLKKRFPNLKESDDDKPQPHYRITLWIETTDSNIEGKPGVARSRETFTFLIVSENELLNDIGKEEETLRIKLEDGISILRDVQGRLTQLVDQLEALKAGGDFSKARELGQDSKDDLGKSYDKVREVHSDYRRILAQLKFGRVRRSIISKVEGGICDPLDAALTVDFVAADEAMSDLQAALKSANADPLVLQTARQKVDAVLARLSKVLESMKDVTTVNMLIDKLVKIEKALRANEEILEAAEREKIRWLIKQATEGK